MAMLEHLHREGADTQPLEALDEFLAGFVNHGSTAVPLYSRALPGTPLLSFPL